MSSGMETRRLAPLCDADVDPRAAGIFESVADEGPIPELYRMLAYAPDQLRAWHGLASEMRRPSKLPATVETVVVLRTAYLVGSERQWRHQVGRAEAAGLSKAQLEAIRTDDPERLVAFADEQRVGIALASEIISGFTVEAATFETAVELLGIEQVIAIAMKVTYFRALAGLLSVFDLS